MRRAYVLSAFLLWTLHARGPCSSDDDSTSGPSTDSSAGDSGASTDGNAPTDAASGDAGDTDAGGELVQGTFNGTVVTFPAIEIANVADSGIAEIGAASAGNTLPNLVLFIDPVTGATTCAANHHDAVIETTDANGGYESVYIFGASSCSINVTAFGANVGDFIDGTFTGTMVQVVDGGATSTTIPASGSFHVKRTP